MADFPGIDIPTAGDLAVLGLDSAGDLADGSGAHGPLLADLTNEAWDRLRPVVGSRLKAELARPDLLPDGFDLYDIEVRISPDCVRTVQRTEHGDLAVHLVTGRSTVIATSTTPTVLGAWADPRFSLDFGVTLNYTIDIPPVAAPVSVTGFDDLRLTAPHVDSQNLSGDLLMIPVRLVEAFSRWSLDGTLAAALAEVDLAGEANERLAGVNDAVTRLAGEGYHYLELLAGDPDDLRRQLGAAGASAAGVLGSLPGRTQSLLLVCRRPDTSGVIEGEIAWPASDGRPVDAAERAIIEALAQPFLGRSALTLVTAALTGARDPGLDLDEADAVVGGRTLVRDSADRFARSPMATRLQFQSVEGEHGVRVWDSAGAAPAEVGSGDTPARGLDLVGPVALETSAFESLLGGRAAYEVVTDMFRRGPQQFAVTCTVPDPRGGHSTGHMVGMWFDDDDRWRRRRYRLEDVETDQPLTVTCALAPDHTWHPDQLESIEPRNWSGTVTVRPPLDFGSLIRDGALQVTVSLADGAHRTVPISVLEGAGAVPRPDGAERAIIIVGGTPADEVALNPQPLPPKVFDALRTGRGEDSAIIIVGGRPGEHASLNPQPLPPKWREDLVGALGEGRYGLVLRGRADDRGAVRVGRLRLQAEEPLGGGGLGKFGGMGKFGALGQFGGLGRFAQRQAAVQQALGKRSGVAGALRQRASEGIEMVSKVGEAVREWAPGAQDPSGASRAGAVEVAQPVETAVDAFGDLRIPSIDPDVLVPDLENPTGHGTVRGIDFRVWVRS